MNDPVFDLTLGLCKGDKPQRWEMGDARKILLAADALL